MHFELVRAVEETTYDVEMERCVAEKRDEILAVLQLARNDILNAPMVNRELLNRPSKSIHGEKILANMEAMYGLVMKNEQGSDYNLTDLGIYALENQGTTFIPEAGLYRLYTTEDPLFDERILGIDLLVKAALEYLQDTRNLSFRREHFKNQAKDDVGGGRTFTKLPDWLVRDRSKDIIHLPLQKNERVQIKNMAKTGAIGSERVGVRISIEVDEDKKPVVRAHRASSPSLKVTIKTGFSLRANDILTQIMGKRAKDLEEHQGKMTLSVSFNETDSNARRTMEMDLDIQDPEIEGYGRFDKVTIRNLSIFPKTSRDAVEWGNWMLENAIDDYTDGDVYAELKYSVSTIFTPKFDVFGQLIDIDQLTGKLRRQRSTDADSARKYWYLQAPRDISQEGLDG